MTARHVTAPLWARLRIGLVGAWRRLTGSAATTTVAFGLLVCACTLIAVAGPRANAQLRTDAFRQLAASTSALDKAVIGTDDIGTLSAAMNHVAVGAPQLQEVQSRLAQSLAQTAPIGPASGYWSGVTTPFTPITQLVTKSGAVPAAFEFTYRNTLRKYVRILAGSLPASVSRHHGTYIIGAAVTTATAKLGALKVGSLVGVPGTNFSVKVTGIVAPRDVPAPFWRFDPTTAAPVLVTSMNSPAYWQVGFFLPAAALTELESNFDPSSTQLTWVYPLALGRLTGAQAISLDHRLPDTLATAGQLTFSAFQNDADITLYSGATAVLGAFVSQGSAVDNVLDLMSVSLAVVGAAIVLLIAWLMAEQRREEFAMLRARGASRRNLGGAVLTACAVAALPAATVGAVIAVVLTPGAGAPLAWWLGGLIVLTALAGPVIITVRQHRGYAAAAAGLTARPDRPVGRMPAIRRLVAESALTLLCVGALIILRRQAAGHGDLVASAAPVLAAVPVAIIMLRLYPAALRPLLRLVVRRGGVISFLGLARAARVAATAVLPAFAMVLALSLVSFAGMVRAAVIRGEVAQSWQEVGTDAVVSTAPGAISAVEQRSVAAVPGVQATAAVAVALASRGRTGSVLTVLIANPAQYAALLAHSPFRRPPAAFTDWHSGPPEHGRPAAVVPVLGSPGIAAQLAGKAGTVEVAGQRIRVRIVGTGPALSGLPEVVSSSVGGYLVLPSSALAGQVPGPDLMLVAGADLDGHALTRLVAKWPGRAGSVTLRSAVLAGLERAPVERDAYAELLFGGIAAAIGCLLVLLLVLLLSARSRQLTLARTATMGLSAAQGRWLTLVEALPQLVAVVVGGLICALGLAPLVGPALDLAVFTGSSTPVPVRVEPVWLIATALGLLVLAMATLSVQTVLADRQAPRSLRIGG